MIFHDLPMVFLWFSHVYMAKSSISPDPAAAGPGGPRSPQASTDALLVPRENPRGIDEGDLLQDLGILYQHLEPETEIYLTRMIDAWMIEHIYVYIYIYIHSFVYLFVYRLSTSIWYDMYMYIYIYTYAYYVYVCMYQPKANG